MDMIVKSESLISVADAIRTKSETTEQLVFPGDFVTAIAAIQSGGVSPQLIVTAPEGSTITAVNGDETVTGMIGADGTLTLDLPAFGTWTVMATLDDQAASGTITVAQEYPIEFAFAGLPDFEYDGAYEPVENDDKSWAIKFLSSGTLTFTKLRGAKNGIDLFLVGGGGGSSASGGSPTVSGGGGGYTLTVHGVPVHAGVEYEIVVGAGGAGAALKSAGGDGGQSSAFGYAADGGQGGGWSTYKGGDGGSGGNGYGANSPSSTDGADGSSGSGAGGTGQHLTTREFGEQDGELYSSGGGNNAASTHVGAHNSGNGGGGYGSTNSRGNAGGSGVVIIRNAR